MKKKSTLLGLLALTTIGFAQSPRMSLYEEFTGENCPPCAATNPGLDVKLTANSANTIPLKWQVAIPSAPSSLTSLYQQNKTEIDARDNYYSISSAPSAIQDGQAPSVFGAASGHPANTTAAILNAAAAVTSPFTVTMTRSWDATYSTLTCSVNIVATGTFATTGTNLKFRLVMTEKEVNYTTAPGTNGETQFHWVARKSYPDLANGTAMAPTWTVGQTQSFTIACVLPSYIWDKSQVEMVGFIQNDGDKKVLQAVLGAAAPLANDAAAISASLPALSCSSSLVPTVNIKNNGSNAITSMNLNPFVNGVANGSPVLWTGTLAVGASTTITMNAITALPAGANTYSVNVTNVNGGVDNNSANNVKTKSFVIIGTYAPAPVSQDFQLTTFPPANWALVNPDGGAATWARVSTAGGFGNSSASTRYASYVAPAGDSDDLILPPMSLASIATPKISFDVAYAAYTAATPENDQLEVMVSTNCGSTWTTVYTKAGAVLSTAPATTSNFVPTATQWRTEIVNLAAYANATQVLVKFTATSDYGNNMYIDNVNLAGNVGVLEADKSITSIDLFPNPANNETSVKINATEQSQVVISILNTVGQVVFQSTNTLSLGANTVNIDTKNFASGIYNVIISTDNGATTKKLSVTK